MLLWPQVYVSGDGPVAMLLEEEDRAPEPPIACEFLEKPDAQNGTTVCQLPSDLDSFPAGAISPEEIQPAQCQEVLSSPTTSFLQRFVSLAPAATPA